MKEQPSKVLQMSSYKTFLKPRAHDAHKGLFGHVLIIGGDYGFFGAPLMAAMAALRVGAGLVTVATRKENAYLMATSHPEIMSAPLQSAKDLKNLLTKATVIAVGPGLGSTAWSKKMYDMVLQSNKPMILDADALNLLAKKPKTNNHWILTPHPGEAARLLNRTTQQIQNNREEALRTLQKKYQGVCVLKGAGTLILGETRKLKQCNAGNPGMATAGMGDILTGVIAGLLAQKLTPEVASELGVLVHAKAADSAAKEGMRGMIATDLLPFLRKWVNL